MAWKGIKHIDVGDDIYKTEYHAEDAHELAQGVTLPETANEGDFYYKTDEKRLYIYISE